MFFLLLLLAIDGFYNIHTFYSHSLFCYSPSVIVCLCVCRIVLLCPQRSFIMHSFIFVLKIWIYSSVITYLLNFQSIYVLNV